VTSPREICCNRQPYAAFTDDSGHCLEPTLR
jgi:hypothetical protein